MWNVEIPNRVSKRVARLPQAVRKALNLLVEDIENNGPVRGNWPNYGKLQASKHHCHLKKGQPTYAAVWENHKDQIRLVRIVYVGTHENATY